MGLEGFLRASESTEAPGPLPLVPRGKRSLDSRWPSASAGEETKERGGGECSAEEGDGNAFVKSLPHSVPSISLPLQEPAFVVVAILQMRLGKLSGGLGAHS